MSFLGASDRKGELRSRLVLGVEPDLATVSLDRRFAVGETEPERARYFLRCLSRHEIVEDRLADLGRNPDPVIDAGDLNSAFVPVGAEGHRDPRPVVPN